MGGLPLWEKRVCFCGLKSFTFVGGVTFEVDLRLWKNRACVCGQVLRLWVVYVCRRYYYALRVLDENAISVKFHFFIRDFLFHIFRSR